MIFNNKETRDLARIIFGDICLRCASVPCECGTPEFEKLVDQEISNQQKDDDEGEK